MNKIERLAIQVLPAHKRALERMAREEGESVAAVVRRLIRAEARRRGLWPQAGQQAQAEAEVKEARDAD